MGGYVNCPDCNGELELEEDGDVIRTAQQPRLHWVKDHTDAVCLDCEAVFVIGPDGRIRRNETEQPLDEVFR